MAAFRSDLRRPSWAQPTDRRIDRRKLLLKRCLHGGPGFLPLGVRLAQGGFHRGELRLQGCNLRIVIGANLLDLVPGVELVQLGPLLGVQRGQFLLRRGEGGHRHEPRLFEGGDLLIPLDRELFDLRRLVRDLLFDFGHLRGVFRPDRLGLGGIEGELQLSPLLGAQLAHFGVQLRGVLGVSGVLGGELGVDLAQVGHFLGMDLLDIGLDFAELDQKDLLRGRRPARGSHRLSRRGGFDGGQQDGTRGDRKNAEDDRGTKHEHVLIGMMGHNQRALPRNQFGRSAVIARRIVLGPIRRVNKNLAETAF